MPELGRAELPIEPGLSGFGALLQRELLKVNTKGPGLTALENNLTKPVEGLRSKIGAVGALLGGALLVGGFKKAIDETVAWGGEIRKLVRSTGLATEAASGLALEAEHFGLDVDTLSRGLGIFEKHLVANDAQFRALGISVRDAHGQMLPFDQILARTSAVFQQLPDGPTKTALALNLFGRNGKALLPFLSAGPQAMKKFSEEAKKLGLSLSGGDLDAITRYKFATRDFTAALHGLEVQVGLKTLPALTTFAHVATSGVEAISHIPSGVLTAAAAFGTFVLAVQLASKFTTAAKGAIGSVAGGLKSLTGAASGAAVAIEAEGTAAGIAAGRIGFVASSEVAAAAAADELAISQARAAGATGGFLSGLTGVLAKLGPIAVEAGVLAGGLYLVGRAAHDAGKQADTFATAFSAGLGTGPTAITQVETEIRNLQNAADSLGGALGTGETGFLHFFEFWKPTKLQVINAEIRKLKDILKDLGIQSEATGSALSQIEGPQGLQGTIDFNKNLKTLVSQGVPLQVADQLKSMGQNGRDAAQLLVDGTQDVRNQFVSLVEQTLPYVEPKLRKFFGQTRTEFKSWTDSLTSNFSFIESSLGDIANSVSFDTLQKAVESAQSNLDSALQSAASARSAITGAASGGSSGTTLAQQQQENRLKQSLADLEARLHEKKKLTLSDLQAERRAKQALADFEARLHQQKTVSASDLRHEHDLQLALAKADGDVAKASRDLATAQYNQTHSSKLVLQAFTDQLTAQENYTKNFVHLLTRNLPGDLVKQLSEMGKSGAGLVAALAAANDKDFNTMVSKWEESSRHARGLSHRIFSYFDKTATVKVNVKGDVKQAELAAQNLINHFDTKFDKAGGIPLSIAPNFITSSMTVQADTVTVQSGIKSAEGRIVRSPIFSLLGEAGDEAVIPLGANKKARRRQLLEESGIIKELLGSAVKFGDGGVVRPSFDASVLRALTHHRAPASAGIVWNGNVVYPKPVDDPGQSVLHALKTLQLLMTS